MDRQHMDNGHANDLAMQRYKQSFARKRYWLVFLLSSVLYGAITAVMTKVYLDLDYHDKFLAGMDKLCDEEPATSCQRDFGETGYPVAFPLAPFWMVTITAVVFYLVSVRLMYSLTGSTLQDNSQNAMDDCDPTGCLYFLYSNRERAIANICYFMLGLFCNVLPPVLFVGAIYGFASNASVNTGAENGIRAGIESACQLNCDVAAMARRSAQRLQEDSITSIFAENDLGSLACYFLVMSASAALCYSLLTCVRSRFAGGAAAVDQPAVNQARGGGAPAQLAHPELIVPDEYEDEYQPGAAR